jgi:hypothetical protein
LTKEFLRQLGATATASDWIAFALASQAYVEGLARDGRQIIRLSMDQGQFSYSKQ